MNPLQLSVRREFLERQLHELQRARISLEQAHRSLSTTVTHAGWHGFARWHFDHAAASNNALWNDATATLFRAEQATSQALWEVDDS